MQEVAGLPMTLSFTLAHQSKNLLLPFAEGATERKEQEREAENSTPIGTPLREEHEIKGKKDSPKPR